MNRSVKIHVVMCGPWKGFDMVALGPGCDDFGVLDRVVGLFRGSFWVVDTLFGVRGAVARANLRRVIVQ